MRARKSEREREREREREIKEERNEKMCVYVCSKEFIFFVLFHESGKGHWCTIYEL